MRTLGSFRLIAVLGLAAGLLGASAGAGAKPDSNITPPLKITVTPASSPVSGVLTLGGVRVQLYRGKPIQAVSLRYDDAVGLAISSDADLGCAGTVKLTNNPTLKCSSGWGLKFSSYTPESVTLTLEAPVTE